MFLLSLFPWKVGYGVRLCKYSRKKEGGLTIFLEIHLIFASIIVIVKYQLGFCHAVIKVSSLSTFPSVSEDHH